MASVKKYCMMRVVTQRWHIALQTHFCRTTQMNEKEREQINEKKPQINTRKEYKYIKLNVKQMRGEVKNLVVYTEKKKRRNVSNGRQMRQGDNYSNR